MKSRFSQKTKYGRHHFKWFEFYGRKVRIDKEIAPLISKLWQLGIKTSCSCQEMCSLVCPHKYKEVPYKDGVLAKPIRTKNCLNSVWLVFESCRDLEKLYNIVGEYASWKDEGAIYNKMGSNLVFTDKYHKSNKNLDNWAACFFMDNLGIYGHWSRPVLSNGKRSTQDMWIEDRVGKNNFVIQPQLTFPHTHLQYVEERLDKALVKKKK